MCSQQSNSNESYTQKSESGDGWNKKVKAAGGCQNQSNGDWTWEGELRDVNSAGRSVLWTMEELGVDADRSENWAAGEE